MYFKVYFDINKQTEIIKQERFNMITVNEKEIQEGLKNGTITAEDIARGKVRFIYKFEPIINIITEASIGVHFISFINLNLEEIKEKLRLKLTNLPKRPTIGDLLNLLKKIQDTHIYFILDEYMRTNIFFIDFDDDRSLEEIVNEKYKRRELLEDMPGIIDEFFDHVIEIQETFKKLVTEFSEYGSENLSLLERYYEYYQANKEFLEQFAELVYAVAYVPNRNKLGEVALYQEFSSETMESICFLEFVKLLENGIGIKKCAIKACNKYFIPEGRSDTIYCDNCRKDGAKLAYKIKVEENEMLKLYNREYQRRYAKLRYYDKAMKKAKLKELNEGWVKLARSKMEEPNLTPELFEEWIDKEKESEKNGK